MENESLFPRSFQRMLQNCLVSCSSFVPIREQGVGMEPGLCPFLKDSYSLTAPSLKYTQSPNSLCPLFLVPSSKTQDRHWIESKYMKCMENKSSQETKLPPTRTGISQLPFSTHHQGCSFIGPRVLDSNLP